MQPNVVFPRSLSAIAFVAMLSQSVPTWAYELVPLPLLPGDTTGDAVAINGDGIIAGASGTRVVFWDEAGDVHLIGPGRATWMNQRGVVVGQGPGGAFTFDVTSGVRTVLGFAPGALGCGARGINDRGDVVGGCGFGPYASAVIWRQPDTGAGAVPEVLPSFGAGSIAFGINSRGQIVGSVNEPDGIVHPATWLPGPQGYRLVIVWTPADDAAAVFARGINDAGQAVGTADVPLFWQVGARARALQLAGTIELGPEGTANAINNSGVIVGFLGVNGAEPPYQPRGVVWYGPDAVPRFLGTLPGDTSSFPRAINDDGAIVGVGDRLPWVAWPD